MSETTRYRKKPVVVEAVQLTAADFNWQAGWDGLPFRPLPQWVVDAVESGALVPGTPHNTDYSQWRVTTLEGEHWGSPGDWLIRGVAGELYFCKPDIFAATYEPVGASPPAGSGEPEREEMRAIVRDVAESYSEWPRISDEELRRWFDRIDRLRPPAAGTLVCTDCGREHMPYGPGDWCPREGCDGKLHRDPKEVAADD